ncbi:hypothetical protein HYH03_012727 [Edaphochlamys debaryana]|uniref:PAS domain-containing protein n=1 Tax=Edaphochlamys debaryana TaxID=47281 RepID=A0A836BU46_9CHLO|nr:hypothetical protein HYH03_012727 [Edaphochlamys debaryana]|eukprot:KAG2488727.1 hypothetical protein HYH03_012727 [Edaphochlamys debaryana]
MTESVASSGTGFVDVPSKDAIDVEEQSERDEVLQILLDAWQLFTTVLNPEMGWDIDPDSTLWKCVSVLSFGWLKDLGYTWYLVILYTIAGLLALNLMLCVWFDYVWPIKVVRGFSYVFIQVFDITSLNFLQLGLSCNYMGPAEPHMHMALFPQYSCSSLPHIVQVIVSGVLLGVFVVVAMLVNMSEIEVNPMSRNPQALGHSGAEVVAFGIKALMTLTGVFFGYPKLAAAFYLVLTLWLAWTYLRWVPHLVSWVNYLKAGVAVAIVGVAAVQVAIVALPAGSADAAHTLTLVMAIGLVPLFLLGGLATWLRIRLFTRAVLKAFREKNPEEIKPEDIYHFAHPRDIEVAARSARMWADLYTLQKAAMHQGHTIIKSGVALYSDSAYATLLHANYMIDVLEFTQTGAKQLEAARKLNPSLMCRFMLFIRQQQATQKAASSTVGQGGSMDLLGYVEYQRKQRMVVRHHKDALLAMAKFWRILGGSSVSFSSLSKSLEDIDTSVRQAELAYRLGLEVYGNSPKLVRLYAKFLETIKQDPWAAAAYNAQADKLEQNKDEDGQGPTLPDGTPMSRMDDVDKAVVVVNAFGDIQVANKKLYSMFGYKKGQLDGKNVMVLMPAHDAKRHPAILRKYIDSGEKAVPYFRHPVVAVHRERVAFTVRMGVSRASGLGEDSVFIGIMEALPMEAGVGRLWITPEGVIVMCDAGFVTCFGYHPEDIVGTQIDTVLRSPAAEGEAKSGTDVWAASRAKDDTQELLQRILDNALTPEKDAIRGPTDPVPTTLCRILHKYDVAKEVRVSGKGDLSKYRVLMNTNVYELRLQLLSDEPQLLMVVERKGSIRHMSGDLSKVLGISATGAMQHEGPVKGRKESGGSGARNTNDQVMMELTDETPTHSLDDFLPAPWKHLNHRHLKTAIPLDSSGGGSGPTMRLVGLHGKPVFVRAAVMSREVGGEPVHVVRMARSSLPEALSERCLRVRVTESGAIQPAHGDSAAEGEEASAVTRAAEEAAQALFGFTAKQLEGCRIWDFIALAPGGRDAVSSSDGSAQAAAKPRAKPRRDLLAEAAAVVDDREGPAAGEGAGEDATAPGWPMGGEAGELNMRTWDSMITCALQTPGISWRVFVVPPSAAAEAAAMGNPERSAALLARRTKQAILRLDVSLPGSGSQALGLPSGQLLMHAELWAEDTVTGVLELDAKGCVASVKEEDLRPAGLLFGLPTSELVGAELGSLLRLGPGQSAAGLLNESGVVKKSSLKTNSTRKEHGDGYKVGPVHRMEGFHRDCAPLGVAVQVVGKPGNNTPVTAILRITKPPTGGAIPLPPPSRALSMMPGAGAMALAARAMAGGPGSRTGGSKFSEPQASLQLRIRHADTKTSLTADSAAAAEGGNPRPGARAKDAGPTPPVPLPGAPDPPTPRASGGQVVLPGSGPLAAGVAALLSSKSVSGGSKAGVKADDPAAGAPAAEGSRKGTPPKLEPPAAAAASKSRLALGSPRTSALLQEMEEAGLGEDAKEAAGAKPGSPPRPPSNRGSDKDGADSDEAPPPKEGPGFDRIKKWVKSDGEFYVNQRASTAAGSAGEPDILNGLEEDDDGAGSYGATSRATSSRWGDGPAGQSRIDADGKKLARPPGKPHHGDGADLEAGKAEDTVPDDQRSDGGESAVSGMSGYSGVEDANTPADFKRGKRYRKLVKLMDSQQARRVVVRFKRGTWLTLLACLAIHVVCFALIIISIQDQGVAFENLVEAGGAQSYLQQSLVAARALDQAQRGNGNNNTYTAADVDTFANNVLNYASLYREENSQVLMTLKPELAQDLFYARLVEVWAGHNETTGEEVYEDTPLWDLITRVYVSAKAVFQNYLTWHVQGVHVADTAQGKLMLESGAEIIPDYNGVLDALLEAAQVETAKVSMLQLIFLVLEGCFCTSCVAFALVYLLRSACDQRYQLYETFLSIPVGLTRALASQTTHMLDDDESDDEEDDDDEKVEAGSGSTAAAAGAVSGAQAAPKRRALFDEDQNQEQEAPHAGLGGKLGKGGKGKDKSEGVEDSARKLTAVKGRGRRQPSMDLQAPAEEQSWVSKLKFWRSNAVAPAPAASRRELKRNSRIVYGMLAITATYSVLIILFYSICYAILLSAHDMVAIQAAVAHTAERTYGTIFFAQEVLSQTNASDVPEFVEKLRSVSTGLRDAYFTLRMGASATRVLGPDAETFEGVTGNGIVDDSPEMTHIFYGDGACLRLGEHLPCPGPDYRFYQVSRTGVDGMMTQLFEEVKSLSGAAEAAASTGAPVLGLNASQWDYIYNIGMQDLADGNLRIKQQHHDDITQMYSTIIVLHVVLFILLMVVFVLFILLVFMPLLRRMNQEKRRIAEMMSQLPTELDVMKLVSAALVGSKPGGDNPDKQEKKGKTTASALTAGGMPAEKLRNPIQQAMGSGSFRIAGDGTGDGARAVNGMKERTASGLPTSTGALPAIDIDGAGTKQWKDILHRANSMASKQQASTPRRSNGGNGKL